MPSYDANLRLFDKRRLATPLLSHPVGGGIWRLKWHPSDESKLLVACMQDGFKVVQWRHEGIEDTMATLGLFDGHESLAYGADWTQHANGAMLAATCSFYDHQLKTWWAT